MKNYGVLKDKALALQWCDLAPYVETEHCKLPVSTPPGIVDALERLKEFCHSSPLPAREGKEGEEEKKEKEEKGGEEEEGNMGDGTRSVWSFFDEVVLKNDNKLVEHR